MEMKCENNPKVVLTLDGKMEVTFTTSRVYLQDLKEIQDKELSVKVVPFRQKRSLSQNAYMWSLVNELSIKLVRPREDIYKSYIKDYGVYEIVAVNTKAVDRLVSNWSKNGLGWFTNVMGESSIKDVTKIVLYYGSSTYNSKEMTRLLDAIIEDCKLYGINTMTISDIMLLQNENDKEVK